MIDAHAQKNLRGEDIRHLAGTRVHVTLTGTIREDSAIELDIDVPGGRYARCFMVTSENWPGILSIVEAPQVLPTIIGSLILGYLLSDTNCMTPRLFSLGSSGWIVVGSNGFDVADASEFAPGWVQVDANTLRPVDEKSAR